MKAKRTTLMLLVVFLLTANMAYAQEEEINEPPVSDEEDTGTTTGEQPAEADEETEQPAPAGDEAVTTPAGDTSVIKDPDAKPEEDKRPAEAREIEKKATDASATNKEMKGKISTSLNSALDLLDDEDDKLLGADADTLHRQNADTNVSVFDDIASTSAKIKPGDTGNYTDIAVGVKTGGFGAPADGMSRKGMIVEAEGQFPLSRIIPGAPKFVQLNITAGYLRLLVRDELIDKFNEEGLPWIDDFTGSLGLRFQTETFTWGALYALIAYRLAFGQEVMHGFETGGGYESPTIFSSIKLFLEAKYHFLANDISTGSVMGVPMEASNMHGFSVFGGIKVDLSDIGALMN